MSEQTIKPNSIESTTSVGAVGGDNPELVALEEQIIALSNERDAAVAEYRDQLLELKAKREELLAKEGEN